MGCRPGTRRPNHSSMAAWSADGSGGLRPACPLIAFAISLLLPGPSGRPAGDQRALGSPTPASQRVPAGGRSFRGSRPGTGRSGPVPARVTDSGGAIGLTRSLPRVTDSVGRISGDRRNVQAGDAVTGDLALFAVRIAGAPLRRRRPHRVVPPVPADQPGQPGRRGVTATP